ncbi:helix-turn-helix domain-containing protein [Burkholderiaceae bacterium UC74_6]
MKEGLLARRFGKCVRELRLAAGLTQVEFAERCGFYQTYLSRVETGRANPTLNAIEVIANALGLSVFEFFEQLRLVK